MRKNKIIFCFLFICILLSSLALCTEAAVPEFSKLQRGDVNTDGKYSIRDALLILRISAGIDKADDLTADINMDNNITAEDAIFIAKLIAFGDGNYSTFVYDKPKESNTYIIDNQTPTIGGYCFHSLTEAVDFINSNPPTDEAGRVTFYFADGVYRENTKLNAPFVTWAAINQDSSDKVVITGYYGVGFYYNSIGVSTLVASKESATTYIDKGADDFHASNITFENSYNLYVTEEEKNDLAPYGDYKRAEERYKGDPTVNQVQALALYVAADRCIFDNCRMIGRQDTFMMKNPQNRIYVVNSFVEGTVDFIYGGSTAVFDKCTINCPYNSGYLTAAATDVLEKYGFLFIDCSITRNPTASVKEAPSDGSYKLGRTWGHDAMVLYLNCKMDSHITTKSDRFSDMGDNKACDARYFEFGSMDLSGKRLDLTGILSSWKLSDELMCEHELNSGDVDLNGEYAPWKWLYGNDGWNPGNFAEK